MCTRLMLGCIGLAWSVCSLGWGDKIYMKNGRHLEGLIKQETADKITIHMGLGTITLDRSQVDRIEKAAPNETEQLKRKWEKQFFTHKKFVPPGLEELADQFNRLERERRTALIAEDTLECLHGEKNNRQNALDNLKMQILDTARDMERTKSINRSNTKEYNELIVRNNSLIGKQTLVQNSIEQVDQNIKRQLDLMASYMRLLMDVNAAFRDEFKKRFGRGNDPNERDFFNRIREKLIQYNTEIKQAELPLAQGSSHAIVTADINGQVPARLLLDTGATYVALSTTIAQRLGLKLTAKTVKVKVADGTLVDATPVLLKSVEVNGMKLNNVQAIVMPQTSESNMDGLLGMSFLRFFSLTIDPGGRKFIINRFNPN